MGFRISLCPKSYSDANGGNSVAVLLGIIFHSQIFNAAQSVVRIFKV